MKNINNDEGRDFQVTLSLVSPQFDIDYLGEAVFKVSLSMNKGAFSFVRGVTFLEVLCKQRIV